MIEVTVRFGGALSAVFILIIVAACGGSAAGDESSDSPRVSRKATDPVRWVELSCIALADWARDFRASADEVSSQLSATAGVQERQETAVEFYSDLAVSTGTLVKTLEDAGVPDTAGGERLADALFEAYGNMEDNFHLLERKAAEISASDIETFDREMERAGRVPLISIEDAFVQVDYVLSDPALDERLTVPMSELSTCREARQLLASLSS